MSSTCIPLHNLSIVSFDPKLLDGTPIRAARFDTRELRPGEPVTVVGLGADSRRALAVDRRRVDRAVSFPLSRTLQFRDANLEVATLVNPPTDFDGVLAGPGGGVRALWSSFATENSARHGAGQSRHAGRARRRGCRHRAQRPTAALARGRVWSRCRCRPRASLELPEPWLDAIDRTIPAAARCCRSCASWPARPPRACCGRATCCSRSTADRQSLPRGRARRAEGWSTLTVWRDGNDPEAPDRHGLARRRDLDRLLLWAGAVLHAPHRAMSLAARYPA